MVLSHSRVRPLEARDGPDLWPTTTGIDDNEPPASIKFIDELSAFGDLDYARRQL
jgi:hypothetical protein